MRRSKWCLYIAIFFIWMPLCASQRIDHLRSKYHSSHGVSHIHSAIQLAEEFLPSNPDSAFYYATRAYELSLKKNKKELTGKALYAMGTSQSARGKYHEASDYLLRSYTLLQAQKHNSVAQKCLKALVENYKTLQDTSRQAQYAQEYLDFAHSCNDTLAHLDALHHLTHCSLLHHDYETGLGLLYEQLHLLPPDATFQRWEIELQLAELYYQIEAYDNAEEHLEHVVQASRMTADKEFVRRCFSLRAKTAFAQQNVEYALQYARITLEYSHTAAQRAQTLIFLVEIALHDNDLNAASTYLQQAQNEIKTAPDLEQQAHIARLQARVAIASGSTAQAIQHYRNSAERYMQAQMHPEELEMQLAIVDLQLKSSPHQVRAVMLDDLITRATLLDDVSLIGQAYQLRYRYYMHSNPVRALDDINEYSMWVDSLRVLNSQKHLANMEVLHRSESQQQELQRLIYTAELNDAKLTRQNTKRNIVISVIAIIMVLSAFILLRYREKRKQDLAITENNLLLTRQHNELQKITTQQEVLVKDLERLNATKTKFFSIISHDLKNAFHSLRTGSKLLSSNIGELDNETITLLSHELKSSSEKVYTLLENLLQWAASQLGSLTVEPRNIEVNGLVEEIFARLEPYAQKKGIELKNRVPFHEYVYADENMMRSVIENLLYNALKFCTIADTITVDMTCRETCCRITVADTGIGIDKETMDKLFRLDHHITTPGTNKEKGSGLGLIVCSEFVHKNKGRIWLESALDEGTTVYVELPRSNNEVVCED